MRLCPDPVSRLWRGTASYVLLPHPWFLPLVSCQAAGRVGRVDARVCVVKQFREPKNRLRILTDDEIARLLEAAEPRLVPFLKVLLTTAVRSHEALALHWPHDGWDTEKGFGVSVVSLKKGVIFIPAALAKNRRDRVIPLSMELMDLFEALPRDPKSGMEGQPFIGEFLN